MGSRLLLSSWFSIGSRENARLGDKGEKYGEGCPCQWWGWKMWKKEEGTEPFDRHRVLTDVSHFFFHLTQPNTVISQKNSRNRSVPCVHLPRNAYTKRHALSIFPGGAFLCFKGERFLWNKAFLGKIYLFHRMLVIFQGIRRFWSIITELTVHKIFTEVFSGCNRVSLWKWRYNTYPKMYTFIVHN